MIPMLDVYLPGTLFRGEQRQDVLVGDCRFSLKRGQINCVFTYDRLYLEMGDAFPIDPHMPLNSASHYCLGLPGALRDSSPDRWGRHLIARQQLHASQELGTPLRTLDEVDYLIGVHDLARQGALRYAAAGTSLMLSAEGDVPPVVELKRLVAASNGIIRDGGSANQVQELLDAGSGSLGGARPKATVVDEGKVLLAKFSHPSDEWNVMAWEKTVLDLAETASIAVPKSKLVHMGADTVLILERFDRCDSLVDGARIPYLSAMTLLGAQDGEQRDYVEVAEELAAFAAHPAEELRRLFVRVAFSVLVHNTDDHLRNLGLLHGADGWRLAPLFDVNINPDIRRGRATSIYGYVGEGESDALHELAASCGLDEAAARELVRGLLGVSPRVKAIARRNGCPGREIGPMVNVVQRKAEELWTAFGL